MKGSNYFSGSGTLVVGDVHCPVEYDIHVLEGLGGMKSAQGAIKGELEALQVGLNVGKAKLELEGGMHAEVLVRAVNLDGSAEVWLTGPITSQKMHA